IVAAADGGDSGHEKKVAVCDGNRRSARPLTPAVRVMAKNRSQVNVAPGAAGNGIRRYAPTATIQTTPAANPVNAIQPWPGRAVKAVAVARMFQPPTTTAVVAYGRGSRPDRWTHAAALNSVRPMSAAPSK